MTECSHPLPGERDAKSDDDEGQLKEGRQDTGVFEEIRPFLEISNEKEHSIKGDGGVGGGKGFDRVLERLIPASVRQHMRGIRAPKDRRIIAIHHDVVIPGLIHIGARHHAFRFPALDEELRLT